MDGHPATATKKSWHGMVERRGALARAGIPLDDIDPQVGALVGIDDLLDAAAVAWSARRLLRGHALTLPDPPERDASGRPVAIWA
jgi:predicted RNase H-like nuclease